MGIVLNLSPVYPATDSAADAQLAAREDGLLVRWYMDALMCGEYPADILQYLRRRCAEDPTGDAQLIAQKLDFLGVNYYHPIISTAGRPFSPTREGVAVTDMKLGSGAWNFNELLMRLDRDYALPPLFITSKTVPPIGTWSSMEASRMKTSARLY